VADGDGGVLVEEQHGYRLADNIAAAYYDGVTAADGDAAALENFNDSRRGAGGQRRAAGLQAAGVHGVEAVYVFIRANGIEKSFGIDVGGKRQLNEDTVDLVTGVEAGQQFEHLFGGHGLGRRDVVAVEAEIGAGLHLAADIYLGRRHVAHQYNRQPRPDALGGERLYLFGHFALDFRGDGCAIENFWHFVLHISIVSFRGWVGVTALYSIAGIVSAEAAPFQSIDG